MSRIVVCFKFYTSANLVAFFTVSSYIQYTLFLLRLMMFKRDKKRLNQSDQGCSSRFLSPRTRPGSYKLLSDHSVRVEIDLRRYCQVVYDYQQAQTLNLVDEINELRTILPTLRSRLIRQYASGLAGSELWDEILLSFQDILDGDVLNSLVMRAMSVTFIEFLKNSMDAMIKGVLDRRIQPEQAILLFELNAWLQDDVLHMKVQDNAIGFSDDYIQNFSQMLNSKSYLSSALLSENESEFVSDKGQSTDVYFGGRGLGLRMFYAMLLDGVELNRAVNFQKYDIPPFSTGVQIRNREDETRGAIIEFFGPIQPMMPHQKSSVSEFVLDDLSNTTAVTMPIETSSPHQSLSVFARRMHKKGEELPNTEDITLVAR